MRPLCHSNFFLSFTIISVVLQLSHLWRILELLLFTLASLSPALMTPFNTSSHSAHARARKITLSLYSGGVAEIFSKFTRIDVDGEPNDIDCW